MTKGVEIGGLLAYAPLLPPSVLTYCLNAAAGVDHRIERRLATPPPRLCHRKRNSGQRSM